MVAPRLLLAIRARGSIDRTVNDRLPGVPWRYATGGSPDDWGAVEAMLIGSVERELPGMDLRSLPALRFVQRLYTGMDGVPFGRFPPGVRFAGNVGAYAPFVSEHAVTLALAAARDIPRAHALVASGTLRPPPAQRLLWGKTALILGYGEIGRAVAARLSGFGVHLLGLNRTGRPAPGCEKMFAADQLVDAVRDADFVFDCRPLTRSTEGTVDASVLAAMRPTAVFVNVGRAATVDEEALYRHLASHPEFRAALDVWWHEDYGGGRITHRLPFPELPNLVGTPHSAGFGEGVDQYVLERALENLERFFRGEPPRYLVDPADYSRP